jgi:hypothetical protein
MSSIFRSEQGDIKAMVETSSISIYFAPGLNLSRRLWANNSLEAPRKLYQGRHNYPRLIKLTARFPPTILLSVLLLIFLPNVPF